MEYSNLFVCLMGICTVFIGLICIIILVSIMSGIVRKAEKASDSGQAQSGSSVQRAAGIPAAAASSPAASSASQVTPEMVAAVSAAIAQELGTDVDAIRILSFKKA